MSDFYVDIPQSGGGGGGSVSSVGLTLPGSLFTVTGSPVTSSGILVGSLKTQTANLVWAGPAGGGAAAPTFRALVSADLPAVTPAFPLVAPVGSVTAPSYAFSESGNDTGMYSTGDGNISWAVNGSLGMALDSPSGNLTVQGTIAASNYPPTGTTDTFAGYNGTGDLYSIPGWNINAEGGWNLVFSKSPNNGFNVVLNGSTLDLNPIANSPNETWNLFYNQSNIDTLSSGFTFGTNGVALRMLGNNIIHNGTSNVGGLELIQNNIGLGNGTDPISVGGISYCLGFGTINANVTITNQIYGYTFQPNMNAAATMNGSVNSFLDGANIGCASGPYTSFNAGPNIAEIKNNANYVGFNANNTIPLFTGNAGYVGLALNGTLGTFGTGGYQGVSVNPTITNTKSAVGLNVYMGNVTAYAGTNATLTEQDLTFSSDAPSSAVNACTIEYTPGGTAGSEVVSGSFPAFSVQIDNGVSTATQIETALNAYTQFTQGLNVTVSGVGSNPQTTFGPTNLAGGTDPGNVKAASLTGDVEINGALSFSGALSIGKLTAFATQAIVNGGGQPASINGLVSQPTVAANATIANGDTLGLNTAMLLVMGANSTVTTSFVGVAALALPAVVSMGAGATIDQVSGGTFAVSLDGGAGGGTIGNLDLCRSIAIPNGITTITKLSGYKFDLPFGDPGTTTWGFYASPTCHNYFAGDLLVGGTAGSDDVVTNSSVAIEIKSTTKAFVVSRMTSAQESALTAINGMLLYNTDTDKLRLYAAGAWVDLN